MPERRASSMQIMIAAHILCTQARTHAYTQPHLYIMRQALLNRQHFWITAKHHFKYTRNNNNSDNNAP